MKKLKMTKKIDFKKINFNADLIVKIIIVALILLFLTLSFVSKFIGKKSNAAMKNFAPQGIGQITVSVKEMQNETIQTKIKQTGNVSSVSEVNTYPDTSGKITKIEKNLGDYVSKGETIAFIDPSKPGSAFIASPVIAPVSGTIIDMPINLGDTVSNSTSIATVGSLKELQLKVYVAEKYSGYLKEGMKAYVHLSSIPNEKFEARTVKISPVVNKQNRTIEVELKFNQYDKRIKPGMFATCELVILESRNAFVIPKKAISEFNGKQTVLVAVDGKAERKEITTGISNDSDIEVKSGLSKGDKVIIAGSVTEGSEIRIAGEK